MDNHNNDLFLVCKPRLGSARPPLLQESHLELTDCEFEADERSVPSRERCVPRGETVDSSLARTLKQAILGSQHALWPTEWLDQFFEFSPHISYGLVQNKGGPCGLLAAVQAHLLADLFFANKPEVLSALVSAISGILWRIGDQTSVTVVHARDQRREARDISLADGFSDRLVSKQFSSLHALDTHVRQLLDSPKTFGALHVLCSALLTRGPDKARADMDEPNTSLITRFNYCSQELVNLLLTSRATSNVFDGQLVLDGGLRLRGVNRRSRVGLLSLHESYQSCHVGEHLKSPTIPVWVVQSESHYTVLFAKHAIPEYVSEDVNLFYYDGLALQSQEVALIVKRVSEPVPSLESLVPLERVLRTKWPDSSVEWLACDRIL